MWNVGNKDGADAQHVLPLTIGAGFNVWLNDKWGAGAQFDYLFIPKHHVANSIQGTVRVLYRFGGNTKKAKEEVVRFIRIEPDKPETIIIRDTITIYEKERIVVDELLRTISFDFDSYIVPERYMQILKFVAEYMKEAHTNDNDVRFQVRGFTDRKGLQSYNKNLSLDRATSVMNVLVDYGVPKGILVPAGYGSSISDMGVGESDEIREYDRFVDVRMLQLDQFNRLIKQKK